MHGPIAIQHDLQLGHERRVLVGAANRKAPKKPIRELLVNAAVYRSDVRRERRRRRVERRGGAGLHAGNVVLDGGAELLPRLLARDATLRRLLLREIGASVLFELVRAHGRFELRPRELTPWAAAFRGLPTALARFARSADAEGAGRIGDCNRIGGLFSGTIA